MACERTDKSADSRSVFAPFLVAIKKDCVMADIAESPIFSAATMHFGWGDWVDGPK